MEKFLIDVNDELDFINPELHGQFIEFLGNCIYDGIWVGENSNIPNYDGFRKDVIDGLKDLEPPVIRWPGGCYADTYHWRNGIGDQNKRPVTYNENFGTYELDTNQFGTHEFMKLCRMVGAKPWLNVNMMTGSVSEMVDWMEYCNRKEPTTLATEREENGSKDPFNVEYWGIGNEVWAGGGTMTAKQYATEYRKYVSAFPNFATSDTAYSDLDNLKRIACGPDGNKPKERVKWTKDFFKALGKYRQPIVDGYDLHFYNWNLKHLDESETEFNEVQWYEVIEGCFELEEVIIEQYELIQKGLSEFPKGEDFFQKPEACCELIVGEWGNWHGAAFKNRPALYQQCTMRDAITTALTLDIFHRNAKKVSMACVAQTVNVLNSLFLTEKENCVLTPNYDVFLMYKVHRGGRTLVIEQTPISKPGNVYMFASRKNNTVSVNLINTNLNVDKKVEINLKEKSVFLNAKVLKGDTPQSFNSFNQPDCIRAENADEPTQNGTSYKITLPAASVNTYQFKLEK